MEKFIYKCYYNIYIEGLKITKMIELRMIHEDNYKDCLSLSACVTSENFADSVTYSLAEAWVFL